MARDLDVGPADRIGWGSRDGMPRASVLRLLTAYGAITLATASCTTSAPTSEGPTTPSLSAPPASTRGSAEQQALAAYHGMWQAYANAGLTADAEDPDLARYAAGNALRTLRNGLAAYRVKGQVLKGDLVTAPRVSGASPSAAPTSVTITDCVDDSKFLVYMRSGGLVNDTPGGPRSTTATVSELDAGGWKVSSFGVQAVNTC